MARLTASKEWREQEALFTWARLHEGQEHRLAYLFHIPNGEKREPRTAAKLLKIGVRPGVPDVFLAVGRERTPTSSPYHGLFLELKRLGRGHALSLAQVWWRNHLRFEGYHVATVAGWMQAAQKVCWYLNRNDLTQQLND